MKKIKWGCIQPLTGGMYIGAMNAIGHKADWVLSYPGLAATKFDDNGNIKEAGNEYSLLKWCEKRDEIPAYQLFDRKPFDKVDINNVNIIDDPVWTKEKVDFSNTDIVVSVPVCSGLSQATIAKDETKSERNNNMIFNAEFALSVIKPKVYIFENAPTLFSNAGIPVRDMINKIAFEHDYSVVYYKTNTKFHDNCQNRPRTFVMMIKNIDGKSGCPSMNGEHVMTNVVEYLSRIPENASQQEPIEMEPINNLIMKFIYDMYGDDFRNDEDTWSIDCIIKSGDKFDKWLDEVDYDSETKEKLRHNIDHIRKKIAMNKNFYSIAPGWLTEKSELAPVCMFKTILTTLHYKENRILNAREWLHLMGHPHDYELYGDYMTNYPKIGQNVPARTAQFIVSEAVRIVENWETLSRMNPSVFMFDNTKFDEHIKSLF